MDKKISITQLNRQWENLLEGSDLAVTAHPGEYRQLKSLSCEIMNHPLDISEYLPTKKRLVSLLSRLDPDEDGTIFLHFKNRLSSADIWMTNLLRVECTDLMAHLRELDEFRKAKRGIRVIK